MKKGYMGEFHEGESRHVDDLLLKHILEYSLEAATLYFEREIQKYNEKNGTKFIMTDVYEDDSGLVLKYYDLFKDLGFNF